MSRCLGLVGGLESEPRFTTTGNWPRRMRLKANCWTLSSPTRFSVNSATARSFAGGPDEVDAIHGTYSEVCPDGIISHGKSRSLPRLHSEDRCIGCALATVVSAMIVAVLSAAKLPIEIHRRPPYGMLAEPLCCFAQSRRFRAGPLLPGRNRWERGDLPP